MKKWFIGLFLLVVTMITAQNKVIVKLEKIDELKVYNGLKINLIKSDEQKLVIQGEKAKDVTFNNKKGVLKIKLKLASTFDSKKVTIDLYYNSNIAELDVNQGAIITSKDIFKQMNLTVSVQEASYIKLNVELDYLKVKGITGGNIRLNGITKNQNVRLVSGASYEGFSLTSDQAVVYVSMGSTAEINATEILDATAKIGAVVNYKGKPKSVTSQESLGGKVNKVQIEKDNILQEKQETTFKQV